MFWPLLLAHLLADYPLQPDRLVQAKKTIAGLTLHVALHLLTMVAILNGILRLDWRATLPVVLAVTALHFAIDLWKSVLTSRWPGWVIGGYLQDQALHLGSILLVSYWYARATPTTPLAVPASWIMYGCGLILATHAAFVTERVFAHRDRAYQQWLNAHVWRRLLSRALLFSGLWVGWNLWGTLLVSGALLFHWQDRSHQHRWRALLIDSSVTLLLIIIAQVANIA